MPKVEFVDKPDDAPQPEFRGYEIERDHDVVWARLPKRVVPLLNAALARQGEWLVPDEQREGIDLTCVFSLAMLRRSLATTRTGFATALCVTGAGAGMATVAALIGERWDFSFGAGVVFVIVGAPGVVRAWLDLRGLHRLERDAVTRGLKP